MNNSLKIGMLFFAFFSVCKINKAEALKILVAVPSDSISITTSSEFHQEDARLVIDGSGLKHHLHQSDNLGKNMWLSQISTQKTQAQANTKKGAVWLLTEFTNTRKIESLSIWNYNQDNHTNRGLQKVYLQYSTNGTNWKTLKNGNNDFFVIPKAMGRKQEPANLEIPLNGIEFKYFCITADSDEGNYYHDHSQKTQDEASNNNQNINYYGLSEIQFLETKKVTSKSLDEITDFSFEAFQAYKKTAKGPAREYLVTFDKPLFLGGKIEFSCNNKQVSKNIPASSRGIFEISGLFPVGYMENETKSTVHFKSTQGEINKNITIEPARKWVLYFLPHSHLDIGYTHRHADVLKLQIQNLKKAIDLVENTKGYPEGSKFKWNVETLWPVSEWMKNVKDEDYFQRFIKYVKNGNIGLNASIGSILTGLCTQEELMHLCDDAKLLEKETGEPINSVMMSDVPGLSWGTVTGLAQNGVKYLSMAPNYVPFLLTGGSRVGYVHREWGDFPFYWKSQSGDQKVLFWSSGNGYSFFHDWLTGKLSASGLKPIWNYLDELQENRFPYDITYLRYTVNGDNGPPDPKMADIIRNWNETYEYPQFKIGTTSEVFSELEEKYGSHIPSFKGDFTPYWEDGAASTAAELAMNRHNSLKLGQLGILWSIVNPTNFPSTLFYEAWRNVVLFSEHTWGASASHSDYKSDFTRELWNEKKAFARKADSITHQLENIPLSQTDKPNSFIHVFNTCAWPRTDVVKISSQQDLTSMQLEDENGNQTEMQRIAANEWIFIAQNVPALSSKVYQITKKKRQLRKPTMDLKYDNKQLSNGILSMTIDPQQGTVKSLMDDNSGYNYAMSSGLNEYIYSGRNYTNPSSIESVDSIIISQEGPVAITLQVKSKAPGCNSLIQEYTLYKGINRLEIKNKLDKKEVYEGEDVRFKFPFNIPNSETGIDLAFSKIKPEREQLDGANKNFFTMNNGVSVEGQKHAILLASTDAPILEIGEPSGEAWMKDQNEFLAWKMATKSSPVLYSWVMNNSWHTNYKATQSGKVTFNYSIVPFDAYSDQAKKIAFEISQPLLAYFSDTSTPYQAGFGIAGSDMVAMSTIHLSKDGKSSFVRLINMSERPVKFSLSNKNNSWFTINECDNNEKNIRPVAEKYLWMKPYGTINLLLKYTTQP